MRIAQVSPLAEAVPPKFYGGTERIISYLSEHLVALGHQVSLFASGDSITAAKLYPGCRQATRLDPSAGDPTAYSIAMAEEVASLADQFDIIHLHTDFLHFPLFRRVATPSVTTLHGRLDLPELQPVFRAFPDMPVISISEAQRAPLPIAQWAGTVPHGLPRNLLEFVPRSNGYLAFLGRITPDKGPDAAIRIALAAGRRLAIAAKVDRVDRAYFQDQIEPLLGAPGIEFIGEIDETEKAAFLGGADALLFPICWPEPFGLVMIEALACGTPVIAYNCGSVSEIIEDGVSGFIVDTETQAIEAVRRIVSLDRATVRAAFERRFTSDHMAAGYLAIYRQLISAQTAQLQYA